MKRSILPLFVKEKGRDRGRAKPLWIPKLSPAGSLEDDGEKRSVILARSAGIHPPRRGGNLKP